jgi:aspartate kinase
MSTLVMKFGGSAVGTTPALIQVLSIVLHERSRWDRLLLVVSALDGVTDALIEAAHLAQLGNRRGYRRIAATLRTRHLALIEELPLGNTERNALQADIDRLLFDMLDLCQAMANTIGGKVLDDNVDAVVGVGERLAARIIAALLRQNKLWSVAIDTTDIIVTDDVYGNATPNITLTRERITKHLLPMLERDIVPVITGFIGGTTTGKPTTLGRGGSDYTASVLSVCIDADEVWIWADVDGMMSADPREVEDARVVPALSYDEVAELAYFGARILHSRMIGPLRQERIPLRIKNVFKPQEQGTLIHDLATGRAHALKAVTSIQGLGMTAERSGPLSLISEIVDETLFNTVGSHADVMISSQSSTHSFVCFVIPTSAGPDAIHTAQMTLDARLRHQPETQSWHVHPVSIVTAIGAKLDMFPGLIGEIFQTLQDVRVLAVAQGPSRCSLSLVVEPPEAESALLQIHNLIINNA